MPRKALGEMLDSQIADFKSTKENKVRNTVPRRQSNGDPKHDEAKTLQKDIKAFLTGI